MVWWEDIILCHLAGQGLDEWNNSGFVSFKIAILEEQTERLWYLSFR